MSNDINELLVNTLNRHISKINDTMSAIWLCLEEQKKISSFTLEASRSGADLTRTEIRERIEIINDFSRMMSKSEKIMRHKLLENTRKYERR